MITSRELMVGNYIKKHDGKVVRVDEQDLVFIKRGIGTSYDPIPLTPEILEQCGFEKLQKERSGYQGYLLNEFEIGSSQDQGFYFSASNREGNRNEINVSLESLHQLQNLFFVLTGQELKIKSAEFA